jgi:hypothetical protein
MWGLIAGGAAVVVVGVVIGLVVALGGGSGSKPTAQTSKSASSLSQSEQCTKDVSPLAQQMENISSELSSNPTNAVTLVNQEANLLNQAAANASNDPPLQTDLSNLATDMSNLGSDVTNQDEAGAQADLTKLDTDADALEQLCGSS